MHENGEVGHLATIFSRNEMMCTFNVSALVSTAAIFLMSAMVVCFLFIVMTMWQLVRPKLGLD